MYVFCSLIGCLVNTSLIFLFIFHFTTQKFQYLHNISYVCDYTISKDKSGSPINLDLSSFFT